MMRKINFAVVGTNFISDNFADAVRLSERAEIVAVYSRKFDTGAIFSQKHGIKTVYTDYAEMLRDPRVDALYIASPHMCHAEQTVLALDAGKHVLCEKMIAADLDGFLLQRAAQKRSGCVLLEAMRPTFDPALSVIKENLPKLGKIRRAALEYCQYSSRYDRFKSGEILNAFNPEMKNTALADIGIYPLHICLNLFGAPENFSSKSIFLSNGFEGMGSITLDYGDMLASITYSKITESVNPSVIEGELGSLTFDKMNAPSEIRFKPRTGEWQTLEYMPASNNMIYEIYAFCDMINGDIDFLPYLDISEAAMRIVDGVYSKK